MSSPVVNLKSDTLNRVTHWRKRSDVGAIILAGGSSKRFGQDKSMLPINGTPLIEVIHNQLASLVSHIIVISNEPARYAFLTAPIVPDIIPGQGPLMGIYSGLHAAEHDINLVVACDIPVIPVDFLQLMFDKIPGFDAVIPKTPEGHWEPLFGIYRKSVLPSIERVLQNGKRKVSTIFQYLRIAEVQVEKAGLLLNLNTLDEYVKFINRPDLEYIYELHNTRKTISEDNAEVRKQHWKRCA